MYRLLFLASIVWFSSVTGAVAQDSGVDSTSTGDGTSGSGAGAAADRAPAPPPPAPAPPPPAPAQPAAEPEEEGDGRAADIIWIEAGFGYSYVDLVQFDNSNLIPNADRFSGSGYAATLAAGFRISFLTLGARGSLASYSEFEVGTAVFDVAIRLPFPTIEPYFRAGIGYGWVGAADYDVPADSDTSVFGLVVEAGAGLDFYLDKIFAIGVGMDGAFLNLSRQRLEECEGVTSDECQPDNINLEEDGDGVGLQLRAHAHASLHF